MCEAGLTGCMHRHVGLRGLRWHWPNRRVHREGERPSNLAVGVDGLERQFLSLSLHSIRCQDVRRLKQALVRRHRRRS